MWPTAETTKNDQEIPAANGHGAEEEEGVSKGLVLKLSAWLKPRFSTQGMWLMAEKFPMALDDIYIDYLWVMFLGEKNFFSPEANRRENGMDGSLETAEETESLVFLGGKLKTWKMERKGKTRRTSRR